MGFIEPHMMDDFDNSLQLWKCVLIFRAFILEIMLLKIFNRSSKLSNYHLEFCHGFLNLWSEYIGIIYSVVHKEALVALQVVYLKI